jgi:hypothetical protein
VLSESQLNGQEKYQGQGLLHVVKISLAQVIELFSDCQVKPFSGTSRQVSGLPMVKTILKNTHFRPEKDF